MPELAVSWAQYHRTIEALAAQIYQSGWCFDQIACVAKGGLRVGDILARLFDRPLAVLAASSYRGPGNRIRGEIALSPHLATTAERMGPRVLLADDLSDSGTSLQASRNWLLEHYGSDIETIRTAVLWCKGDSAVLPDYYVRYLPDTPWIRQPFERYEQMSPAELLAASTPTEQQQPQR